MTPCSKCPTTGACQVFGFCRRTTTYEPDMKNPYHEVATRTAAVERGPDMHAAIKTIAAGVAAARGRFETTPEVAAYIALSNTPAFKLNGDQTAAVATEVFLETDMTKCPRGAKVQLEGRGGVLVYSNYDGDPFWVAWAPLPRRRTV